MITYQQVIQLTDDEILTLLIKHKSIGKTVRALTGKKYHTRIRQFISDKSKLFPDWTSSRPITTQVRYTKEQVIEAFKIAECWSDVYRYLGLTICGHNKKGIIKFAIVQDITIPEFTKQQILKSFSRNKQPWKLEDIFCKNSTYTRANIRQAVIRHKVIKEYKCLCCDNIGIWNNEPITLELDHINGIHNDNRIENLRWLCPNCHSQTHTFKGKNKKKQIS